MSVVVRLGPLPLLQRRPGRLVELERIVGDPIDLVEVSSVAELLRAITAEVVAVVLDTPGPGGLAEAVEADWLPSRPASHVAAGTQQPG